MSSNDCGITINERTNPDGTITFSGVCDSCGVPVLAASREDAWARFEEHRAIPAPPAAVTGRPVTLADVDAYPEWFLNGRGYPVAAAVKCEHGVPLVGFCLACG